jgi:autotransporter-associated beta strand protein
LLVVLLLCWIVIPTTPVLAITRTWTHSESQLFSNPNNWSPTGVPQSGDDLYFTDDANVTGPNPIENDLVGLSINSLGFRIVYGYFGVADWELNGNPITITGPIATDGVTVDEHVYINCGLVLGGDISVAVAYTSYASGDIALHLTGSVDLNGHRLLLLNREGENSTLDLSGVISGTGTVVVQGGPVVLSGNQANTFHGSVFVTPQKSDQYGADTFGYLVLNKQSGVAVTERLHIEKSSTVILNHSEQIGDTAVVEIIGDIDMNGHTGGGMLLLNGYNETIGKLYMTNYSKDVTNNNNTFGDCVIDTGGGTLTLSNDILSHSDSDKYNPVLMGNLNLPDSRAFTVEGGQYAGLGIEAQITGSGGINKYGNSALLLQTSNSFSGGTAVLQGIVDVRNNSAFGAGSVTLLKTAFGPGGGLLLSSVVIGGNPLYVLGGDQITPEMGGSLLTSFGFCSWAGPIELDTNLVVQADNMLFLGQISGPGGMEFLSGMAQLGGTLGNSYTGPTLVHNQLLKFAKPYGTNACAGPIVVGGGAQPTCEARWLNAYQNVGATLTLYTNGLVNLNGNNEDFGPVTFNGGEVDSGNGQFAIYAPLTVNPAATTAVINGYLGLPPGADRVFIVGDGAQDCDLLVNAVVLGNPSPNYFIKQGPGAMCMLNANTFNAVTLLQEGIIDVHAGASLGTAGTGCVISDGATLRLSGIGGTLSQNFEIAGAGFSANGAIALPTDSSWTIAGDMLLDNAVTFDIGPGSSLALNGSLSGASGSVVEVGGGILSLSGSSANTYGGDTTVNAGQLWLQKSDFVNAVPNNLIIGPGPAGTLAEFFQLGGVGGTTISVNANSQLNLNGHNQTLTQLNLRDGGSVVTGGGALNLPAGANVSVGSQGLFGSHVSSIITGNITLPSSGTVYFTVGAHAPSPPFPSGPELDVQAAIGGFSNHGLSGYVNKLGPGQMRLSGNNTFPDEIDAYSGTLIAASPTALGNSIRGIYIGGGSTLALDGGISIASAYVVLDTTNSTSLASWTGANSLGGTLYLNRDSTISINSALSLNSAIVASGSLIETGPGSLTLGGSSGNTFAGEVFVNQGTLLLNKPNAVAAVPGALEIGSDNGGPAAVARNLNSYQIAGNIYVHSTGLYDVNGQQENTDGLLLYGNATVQTGAGYVSLKTGAPIYVYPGSNTTATINGNLMLDPGNHLLTVGSGTSLPGVYDLVINSLMGQTSTASSIEKQGAGRLRLTADNTYLGGTTIDAGTLQVDGFQRQSATTVQAGARLQGSGTVGTLVYNGASGVVAPGGGVGLLTCSNFSRLSGSGIFEIELNGTTPGISYDQMIVHGTVDLTGITLDARLNFASAVSNSFTILGKDGTSGITGTFNGLREGTNFFIGGELFTITYVGGGGTDVVLTRLVTPPKPVISIERVLPNSVRVLWTTNDPAYALQYATNLGSPLWTAAIPAPAILGTNFVVTNSTADSLRIYRLMK